MSDVPTNIPVVADPLRGYLPTRAHADDAAFDLVASENVYLKPGDTRIVSCAFKMAIPEGFAGLVLPRSGLAGREGLTVLNAPGLIDPGYRGDVRVMLYLAPSADDLYRTAHHWGNRRTFHIKPGDRIAQLLIVWLPDVCLTLADRLEESERGEGGFGSTGVAALDSDRAMYLAQDEGAAAPGGPEDDEIQTDAVFGKQSDSLGPLSECDEPDEPPTAA